MVSELKQVGVDLGRLVKLLGDNLYSTPEVFLRELVQNAHDAITRRQIESGWDGEPEIVVSSFRDGAGRAMLAIEDNGCGLTAGEIHEYLATIGRGVTGDLRTRGADRADGGSPLIGAFGLGFLSAYVVSDLVTFATTSYQRPGEAWVFSSRGGNTYSVDRRREVGPVGSRLELTLKDEFERLADHRQLFRGVARSCALLPHPIYVSSAQSSNRVNGRRPPWRGDSGEAPWFRWHADALGWLHEQDNVYPPLAVMPVGGEPGDAARGVLWLNDFYSFANNDHRSVKVYIRNMLVADNERELLPHWAGFVSGAIEADELTPTASREALRRDDAYAEVRRILERDLLRGLSELARAAPSTPQNALWRRVRDRHNHSMLVACCANDDLMEALRDELVLETSAGRYTVRELARLDRGRVCVSSGRSGVDALFAKVRGQPVVDGRVAGHRLFLQRYFEFNDEKLICLGQDDHNSMFPRAEADPAIEDFARRTLAQPGDELRFTTFEPASLPIVRIWNEFAEARRRFAEDEGRRRISLGALRLAKAVLEAEAGDAQSYLYINVSSPIWRSILAAEPGRQTAAAALMNSLVALLDENAGPGREKALEQALLNFLNGLNSLIGGE